MILQVLDPGFRKPFGNCNRWFTTVVNQPQVKKVLGAVALCEKMAQFDAKKFNEMQGKGDGGKQKKEKAPAKEEKKAAPKKEEKKKEEPPMEEPKPEKAKDPYEGVPKGNWDMDDFKRFYSNNDEDKSIPYFWEKFDKENFSIWRCDYKYNDELTMVFMSCNLIGGWFLLELGVYHMLYDPNPYCFWFPGMFQRLEKLRKNAFASVCLFGENNNSTISGIWVWRGQDLAFELSPDWQIDYASYDWKKLNADDPETKKLVEQYFKWEGADLEGRKFNQGKIFK